MRILVTYLLPATLVAGFLCSFFYEAARPRIIPDDCFFDAITHKFGLGQSIAYCYQVANGRWVSHIVSSLALRYAGHNYAGTIWVVTLFMLVFLSCFAFLFRHFMPSSRGTKISFLTATAYGAVFTALVYFIQYPGRGEIWFWISSASNHQLSVALSALLAGLLLANRSSWVWRILIFATGLAVGGLNEVNALCGILLLVVLFVWCRQNSSAPSVVNYATAIGAIILSLCVNLASGGYGLRMEGLPEFSLLQSLKNTAHSFLLFFLEGHILSVIELLVLLALLLAPRLGGGYPLSPMQKKVVFAVTLLVCLSFFLHCFVLSDIVPARGALWGYTLILFLLYGSWLSRTNDRLALSTKQ